MLSYTKEELVDSSGILVLSDSFELRKRRVVWNPYYGVHLKRIEAIEKKFLNFALRTLCWSRDIELSPYF
jgi:hypothetical protein